MPQGNYDARESGNYKIVNGKRVPLPPRSSNDARSSGERGPKGARTYRKSDPDGTQLFDNEGVKFQHDFQGRPISSIQNDMDRNKRTR